MPSFYIAPNSTIILLRDIPIDEGQEHTLWFANKEAQLSYFNSKAAYTLTEQYYTRQGRGVIKVEAVADSIYDCNYMMFRNTSFGLRWFFAFITSIEYVNNHTASITFVIDQMQTWFIGNPTASLGECFVEREHSLTDNPGDNLVPEDLETGEYIYSRISATAELAEQCIVVASTVVYNPQEDKFVEVSGGITSGLYTGALFIIYPNTAAGATQLNDFLEKISKAGKEDAIISVFMAPNYFYSHPSFDGPWIFFKTYQGRPSDIDGYTPKNNKLFTAPYISIFVKTPTNAGEFYWEYFLYPNNPQFRFSSVLTTSPATIMAPTNYKTKDVLADIVPVNYVETMTLDGYPQLCYSIDAYKAWLAQNSASLIVNGALGVVNLGRSIEKSTSLSKRTREIGEMQMMSSLSQIGNTLAQIHAHAILPPHAMGNADGNAALASDLMNFFFFTKTIRHDFAEIIDNYFQKFGYATHKVKVPNIHARQYWTYTKTVDCIIHGNLPTEAITEIQNLFNRGITFWAVPENVGQYHLTNSPLGE